MKNNVTHFCRRLRALLCGLVLVVSLQASAVEVVIIGNASDVNQPVVDALTNLMGLHTALATTLGQYSNVAHNSQMSLNAANDFYTDGLNQFHMIENSLLQLQSQLQAAIANMTWQPVVDAIEGVRLENNAGFGQLNSRLLSLENTTRGELSALRLMEEQKFQLLADILSSNNLSSISNLLVLTNLAEGTNFGTFATNLANVGFDLANVVSNLGDIFNGSNSVVVTNQVAVTNVFTNSTVGAEVLTQDLAEVRNTLNSLNDRANVFGWDVDWQSLFDPFQYTNMATTSGLSLKSMGTFMDTSASVYDAPMGGPKSALLFTFPGTDQEIDLDFSKLTWWGQMSTLCFDICQLAMLVGFAWFVLTESKDSILAAGGINQLKFPKLTALGNSLGWIVWPAYAAIVLGLLGGPVAFVLAVYNGAWFNGFAVSNIIVNPFTWVANISAEAAGFLTLLTECVPVSLAGTLILVAFGVRFAVMGAFQVKHVVIRMLPA